jgi:hypothetical protein
MSGVLLYTSSLDSSCELSRIRYCGYCGSISKQGSSSYDDVIVHVCVQPQSFEDRTVIGGLPSDHTNPNPDKKSSSNATVGDVFFDEP